MIIEMLLNLIFNIFKILTLPINISSLPDNALNSLYQFTDYILGGLGLLNTFVHLNYVLILFGIIIGIDIAVALYHFVMWIIRKIPMLSMS